MANKLPKQTPCFLPWCYCVWNNPKVLCGAVSKWTKRATKRCPGVVLWLYWYTLVYLYKWFHNSISRIHTHKHTLMAELIMSYLVMIGIYNRILVGCTLLSNSKMNNRWKWNCRSPMNRYGCKGCLRVRVDKRVGLVVDGHSNRIVPVENSLVSS